ncbi:hypothetical protein BV25DRAFT_1525168 [Artomyces pyxidatus]|uniref:Uncharacterized protein n=1 Tax=Artomyces pyxidatus TaxID=48021 RepID=A0ACB8TCD3_9AGAM|nr:hypothetical protein BV25DRAFT_1525168 [Artomyces pyxidatus]
MRLISLVSGAVALVALHAQAAPLSSSEGQGLLNYVGGYVQDVSVYMTCPGHDSVSGTDDASVMDEISFDELESLDAVNGEEYWFRFENSETATSGDILQLPERNETKAYEEHAYKWISHDHTTVTEKSKHRRVPCLHVLPAGTRAALLKIAHRFEETRVAKRAVNCVTKDHEHGVIGINGILKDTLGRTALHIFRSKVVRTVVKETVTKAGVKKTKHTTITKRKVSKTTLREDQERLERFE